MFDLWSTYLGDQWSIGAWDAMRAAAPERLPAWMAGFPIGDEPRQELKEYDPEWGKAFWTGTVAASCDHERMLRSVKVPDVLLTHHFRVVDEHTGALMGALSRHPSRAGAGAAPWGRCLGDVPRVPDRRSRHAQPRA